MQIATVTWRWLALKQEETASQKHVLQCLLCYLCVLLAHRLAINAYI